MQFPELRSRVWLRMLISGFSFLLIICLAALLFLPAAKSLHSVSQLRRIIPEQGERVASPLLEGISTAQVRAFHLAPSALLPLLFSPLPELAISFAIAIPELCCVHRC